MTCSQKITVWDAASGAVTQTLRGHTGGVGDVAFSPDGRCLASAADDGTVRLWNTATWTAEKTLQGGGEWVRAVAFAPDGCTIASNTANGRVVLWDAASGAQREVLEGGTGAYGASIAFSPDGAQLAVASPSAVRVCVYRLREYVWWGRHW